MSIKNLALILFTFFCIVSCQKKQPEEIKFDPGTMTGNIYKSKFFNFQITIPEGWDIQSKEQVKEILEAGKDAINNEKITKLAESAEINTANLFTVYKYEVESATGFNPGIAVLAENLRSSGIETGAEYLVQAKRMLESTGIAYTFPDRELKYKLLNGDGYSIMDLNFNYQGFLINQTYMATVKNNYVLLYIFTYSSPEERKELEDVLKTVKPYKTKNV